VRINSFDACGVENMLTFVRSFLCNTFLFVRHLWVFIAYSAGLFVEKTTKNVIVFEPWRYAHQRSNEL